MEEINNQEQETQEIQNNELLTIIGTNKYIKSSKTGTVYKQFNNDSYYRDYYHNKKGDLVPCTRCGKLIYQNYLEKHMMLKSCLAFTPEKKENYDILRIKCEICGSIINRTTMPRHLKSKKCRSKLCNLN